MTYPNRRNTALRTSSLEIPKAAIAAAPTVITGIHGMNFRYFTEFDWRLGYPLAIVLMITAVLMLHWNFRRIGWL